MDINKVLLILGTQKELAKKLGVPAPQVSLWASCGAIPAKHNRKLKAALKARVALIKRAYDELIK